MEPYYKVVSDGTLPGTKVFDMNDNVLPGVVKAEWVMDATGGGTMGKLKLTVINASLTTVARKDRTEVAEKKL